MGYRIPITLGNIEPLAYKPYRPGKMALVCEGGGQRGIFTAGVLDEFQRARFNPFDLMIGTSAGAQNLSAFICGQMGYARRVITRYTTSAEFFNPLRFVRGGHLIDLDWLIDTTSQQLPLAMDVAEKHLIDGREFLMCACRSDDFEPTYLPAQRASWLPAIKASSAIPGFYRMGVDLDGVSYQDGGISDAIPVEEAYRRGADTIVVIRTVPSQMYYTPQWMKRMEHWLSESSLQQMVRILQHHEQSYHRIQQFIEKPPGKLRIFEIFPPKPLASNALGSRLTSLNQDYHLGRRCGRYFLATVGHWLVEQDKLDGMKVKKALSRRLIQPENVVMPSPIITDVAHPRELSTQPEPNLAAREIILPGDVPRVKGVAVTPDFTDTHCHFDFPPFSGQELESLALAERAGVRRIIVPTVTADRFARVVKLARDYPPLFAALGLHPLYIAQHQEAELEQLAGFLASRPQKLVAVGEIGLDLYMENPQFERQQRVLKAQLKLAKEHDLPVILHSRRSHDQLAAMLRRSEVPRRGVVHGFAGSLSQAQAFIRLGYYIGVGGTISYERAQKTRSVMAQLPLTSLLLETDAPDMPLAGYQGQPNRPERAAEVFQELCRLRPESAEDIAAQLQHNTHALFTL